MSARTRRLLGVGLGVLAASTAGPVVAHAIGQTFPLPVPLWLYLAGAGAAVAASFVVVAAFSRRRPSHEPRHPMVPLPASLVRFGSVILAGIGLLWWYGAMIAGFVVGEISPLPGVLVWVGIWIGLPIVAALLGNPWPSLSPFRTTFALLEAGARRIGAGDLDARLSYPSSLARWPAVALLFTAVWMELVLPGVTVAATVAITLLAYTVLTIVGMALFGRAAWLANAELLEVQLGWFGRIGPVARRSVDPALCRGCSLSCDPGRCVDCPECTAVAESGEQRTELRPWFLGLAEPRRTGWSDAAFVVLVLAAVSYDGLMETLAGGMLLDVVLPASMGLLGPTAAAFVAAETSGLALTFLAFLAAFAVVIVVMRALSDPTQPRTIGQAVGAYAATLLPIAAGYMLAHYLTLLIQGVVWLPALLADPNFALAPALDFPPIAAVWYLSVAAIVGGHIAAVALGHRLLLLHAPRRAIVAGLPLVALMVGYTVLSLWIIAQPIVIEPDTVPAALVRR